jgi:hypothetical protein
MAEGTSLVSIAAKSTMAVMLLTLLPTVSNAAAIDRLYCNGLIHSVTETPEYVWPRKAVLNGDHFRLWVERNVPRNTQESKTMVTFDENWGVGYQLDGSAVAGIVPIRVSELTMMLSFSNLSKGPHHLRIGLMTPDGQLVDDNTFCFSSPGRFILTDR